MCSPDDPAGREQLLCSSPGKHTSGHHGPPPALPCPFLFGAHCPPPPARQWKQSKDFSPLTLYFREKELEKEVGVGGGRGEFSSLSSKAFVALESWQAPWSYLTPQLCSVCDSRLRDLCLSPNGGNPIDWITRWGWEGGGRLLGEP